MFTQEFLGLLSAWTNTKQWEQFPFSGGWAEQPCQLMDVFNAFNQAYNQHQEDK